MDIRVKKILSVMELATVLPINMGRRIDAFDKNESPITANTNQRTRKGEKRSRKGIVKYKMLRDYVGSHKFEVSEKPFICFCVPPQRKLQNGI